MVCVGALLKDPPGGRKCTAVSRKCTSPCVAPNPPQASPRANYFGCIRKHHAEPPQELNLTLESNTHTHHTPHSKSPRHTPGENYWHPTRIVECKRLQPKQGRTHHNSNSSQIMQSQTPNYHTSKHKLLPNTRQKFQSQIQVSTTYLRTKPKAMYTGGFGGKGLQLK